MGCCTSCAEAVGRMLQRGDDSETLCRRALARAEAIRHEIGDALAREFMPPMDPEKLLDLSEHLRTLTASLGDVPRLTGGERTGELALWQAVAPCLPPLARAVAVLDSKRPEPALEAVRAVFACAVQADDAHRRLTRELFCRPLSPQMLTVSLHAYESLRRVVAVTRRAAHHVEQILLRRG